MQLQLLSFTSLSGDFDYYCSFLADALTLPKLLNVLYGVASHICNTVRHTANEQRLQFCALSLLLRSAIIWSWCIHERRC